MAGYRTPSSEKLCFFLLLLESFKYSRIIKKTGKMYRLRKYRLVPVTFPVSKLYILPSNNSHRDEENWGNLMHP